MVMFWLGIILTLTASIAANWITEQLGFWAGLIVTAVALFAGLLLFGISSPVNAWLGPKLVHLRWRMTMYVVGALMGAGIGLGLAHFAVLYHSRQTAGPPPGTTMTPATAQQIPPQPSTIQHSAGGTSPNIITGHNSSVVMTVTPPPVSPREERPNVKCQVADLSFFEHEGMAIFSLLVEVVNHGTPTGFKSDGLQIELPHGKQVTAIAYSFPNGFKKRRPNGHIEVFKLEHHLREKFANQPLGKDLPVWGRAIFRLTNMSWDELAPYINAKTAKITYTLTDATGSVSSGPVDMETGNRDHKVLLFPGLMDRIDQSGRP